MAQNRPEKKKQFRHCSSAAAKPLQFDNVTACFLKCRVCALEVSEPSQALALGKQRKTPAGSLDEITSASILVDWISCQSAQSSKMEADVISLM